MSGLGPRAGRPTPDFGDVSLRFDGRELRDLAIAWLVLGVAFAIFLAGGGIAFATAEPLRLVAVSLLTAGIGFLLHELAHKVAAVRLGMPAAFRADYGMLFVALMAAFAGFLFAAPGAVYHPSAADQRNRGLIALAGPATNLALAVVFLPLVLAPGVAGEVGNYGVIINVLLAGFNMLPFGPLDGKKVLGWNPVVFGVVFLVSAGLAVLLLFG